MWKLLGEDRKWSCGVFAFFWYNDTYISVLYDFELTFLHFLVQQRNLQQSHTHSLHASVPVAPPQTLLPPPPPPHPQTQATLTLAETQVNCTWRAHVRDIRCCFLLGECELQRSDRRRNRRTDQTWRAAGRTSATPQDGAFPCTQLNLSCQVTDTETSMAGEEGTCGTAVLWRTGLIELSEGGSTSVSNGEECSMWWRDTRVLEPESVFFLEKISLLPLLCLDAV